jgi:hypothetical protein
MDEGSAVAVKSTVYPLFVPTLFQLKSEHIHNINSSLNTAAFKWVKKTYL